MVIASVVKAKHEHHIKLSDELTMGLIYTPSWESFVMLTPCCQVRYRMPQLHWRRCPVCKDITNLSRDEKVSLYGPAMAQHRPVLELWLSCRLPPLEATFVAAELAEELFTYWQNNPMPVAFEAIDKSLPEKLTN